jgi:hypothetical protein
MCGRIRAQGLITIGVLALLAAAATLTLAATAGATPLEYTFSGNNQGWQQAQDPANGPFVNAGFQSSGGNPGGRLTAKDSGPEDGCPNSDPCQLLTFYSPMVPTLGANYGGTAAFDLRSSVDPSFAAEFVLLPEGPDYLDGLIPESLGTGYHHLSIPMSEAGNWAVCPYVGGTCNPPSQAQFMALIGATDRVAVIADVGPNGQTGETYDLDNVTLTDGGPLPPPNHGGPPPKKPKKCKKKKKHHGHHAAAAKKCKKKNKKRAAIGLRG